jgi:hypothetical protein
MSKKSQQEAITHLVNAAPPPVESAYGESSAPPRLRVRSRGPFSGSPDDLLCFPALAVADGGRTIPAHD